MSWVDCQRCGAVVAKEAWDEHELGHASGAIKTLSVVDAMLFNARARRAQRAVMPSPWAARWARVRGWFRVDTPFKRTAWALVAFVLLGVNVARERFWGAVAAAFTLLWILVVAGCSSEEDAARALRGHGFDAIDVRYSFMEGWSCGDGETGYEFRAKNARGERVGGTVCCGQFAKACTVRF